MIDVLGHLFRLRNALPQDHRNFFFRRQRLRLDMMISELAVSIFFSGPQHKKMCPLELPICFANPSLTSRLMLAQPALVICSQTPTTQAEEDISMINYVTIIRFFSSRGV